jgi:hypothetical protein
MAPFEGAGPGSTPGRSTVFASVVKGTSRGSAKAEFLVRFQVGALWPNSKRQRDPAVTRGCAGSTPAGHPLMPVQLDRSSTPPVKGRVRVRVPPLALSLLLARPSEGIEALNLGRVGSTPALAAWGIEERRFKSGHPDILACSSIGRATRC